MGTLTHKAARAAYGTAIDAVLKHVKKDREKGLLELVDLTEKYMGDNFQKENYEATRKMIQDPDNKWVKFVKFIYVSSAALSKEGTSTTVSICYFRYVFNKVAYVKYFFQF